MRTLILFSLISMLIPPTTARADDPLVFISAFASGDKGAIRTWWSGARDRTLHPEFELKVKRAGEEPQVVAIPQSGEVFELRENLHLALDGFRRGRSILAPDEAGASIAICLAGLRSRGVEIEIPEKGFEGQELGSPAAPSLTEQLQPGLLAD